MLFSFQVQGEQLTCHSYVAMGLEQWDHRRMTVNCSGAESAGAGDAGQGGGQSGGGVRCQLIVEPEEDPAGYTADCSDAWSTSLVECWDECRTNVDVGGYVHRRLCSFCCDESMCNTPHAYTDALFPPDNNSNNAATTTNIASGALITVTALVLLANIA